MANINTRNVSKQEELLYKCFHDKIAFGKGFLPKDFMRSETPPFHYEVMDAISDLSIRYLANILPRGHGKTILTKCDLLHQITFNHKAHEWGFVDTPPEPLFIGWVAASSKISLPNLDYVKVHIMNNEDIIYFFGNLEGKKEKRQKWTEDIADFKDGSRIVSKSNLAGIRGGTKGHKRYDLIVLDDFEDENNTLTVDSRAKLRNLVTAVVYPALEPGTGRIRINGTPVHFDSFINRLLEDAAIAREKGKDFLWKIITYVAEREDGSVLWPGHFGKAEIAEKKRFYIDSGMPEKFYQEYQMKVQNEEDAIWTRHHIKEWEGKFYLKDEQPYLDIVGVGIRPVNVFVGCDPATDSTMRDADFNVIIAIAVTPEDNIYVISYIRKRRLPVLGLPNSEKLGYVDYIFEYKNTFSPSLFVIEDTVMSKAVFQSINAEMLRKRDFTVMYKRETPGNKNKRARIHQYLSPRLTLGQIHLKKEHMELRQEIITFGPRMAHDDLVDGLAYAVQYANAPEHVMGVEDGVDVWKLPVYNTNNSWVTI